MVVLAGVPLVIVISLSCIITWIKLMKRKRIGIEEEGTRGVGQG